MTPTTGPYMSATVQYTTLIIALFVCAVVYVGLRGLWADWRRKWAAEDFAAGYFEDRDNHLACDRAAMVARRSA